MAKKAAMAILASFALAACDTGLGESIDTSVPTVSISAPAASAVLSGEVKVEGTCFDDKKIARVVIKVTNTGNNEVIGTYDAAIAGNNWTLSLNKPTAGSYPLKDGTYSANVVCYDGAGRQSVAASRVFEIDNTPPVFCVTSPNSIEISDPAAYGRSVKIRGEIADDHPISSMDIRVFKYENSAATEITGLFAKTSFSGFETAGGTEVKIAQYFPLDQIPENGSDDYLLYKNYMAMYDGVEIGKTVNFYIFPFLTDAAGNVSSNCYIQTQLKKLVSDACNIETTSDSLQTAQFKKMINGSYKLDELTAEQVGLVKTILSGDFVQSSYKYLSHMDEKDSGVTSSNCLLAMSVNANNSPMYEFGGYTVDSGFTEASAGGQITVRVSAGLDGTPIVQNTLRAQLWECDDTLAIIDPTKPSYSSDNDDFNVTDGTTNVKDLTQSVTTGTYTVTLPLSLVGGTHYLLTATGVDEDGNDLYSDTPYAFMVTVSANVPTVDFDGQFFVRALAVSSATAPEDCYQAVIDIEDKTEKSMKQSGSYVQVTPLLYTGYYAAKTALAKKTPVWTGSPVIINDTEIVEVSAGTYKANVKLNLFDFSPYAADNYTVALKILAKNKVASSEAVTYIFWVDNAKPNLSVTSPNNGSMIMETDPNYSAGDGKYTARGYWSDVDGSGTYRLWVSKTQSSAPAFAYSKCGASESADGHSVYYEKKAKDAYLPLGVLAAGTDVSKYYTLTWPTTDWTEITGVSQTASQTNWNAPFAVTESENQTLAFVAMDAAGNVSDIGPNQKRTGISFDFGVPTLALTAEPSASAGAQVKQYYTAANNKDAEGYLCFEITAEDTFKIASLGITAEVTKNGATTVLTEDNPSFGFKIASTSATDKKIVKTVRIKADQAIGIGDGDWVIKAVALDAWGRKAERTQNPLLSTTIDCLNPAFVNYSAATPIAFGKNADGLLSAWHKDQTLTITGKVSELTSGLDTVYYWLKYPSRTDPLPSDLTDGSADGSVTIGGSKGTEILYKIMPDKFEEGEHNILYVQAIDQAKNKNGMTPYEIKVDQTPPMVSAAWYTYDGGDTMNAAAGSVMTNKTAGLTLTLYGAASDSLSGLKTLLFKVGNLQLEGVSFAYSTAESSTASEYKAATYQSFDEIADKTAIKSWKAVVANEKLLEGDLFVSANDDAGNSSEQKAFAIVVDTEPPTIELTSPKTLEDGQTGNVSAINGSVNFKGKAGDDKGLSRLAVSYSPDKTAWTQLADISDSSMYNWSVLQDVTTQSGDSFKMLGYDNLYAGEAKPLYIKLVATDKANNIKEKIYKYSIDPKGDRPKVTITNVALEDMASGLPAWRTGTSDIYGSVFDDDDTTNLVLKYKRADDADWTPLTLTGTSFTITGLAEGQHTLLFQVTDGAGTVFTSNQSASYISPMLYGKKDGADSGAFEDGDTRLYVKIDTEAPATGAKAYYKYSKQKAAYGEPLNALGTIGGDATMFKYKVNAKDTNGIKGVTVSMKYKDASGFDKEISTTGSVPSAPIDGQAGYEGFEVEGFDISAVPSGAYNATIEVEDKAGLKKTGTIQIAIDNTPPEVTINSPAEAKKVLGTSTTVYGGANEFGTTKEGGKTVSTIYYALSPIGKSDTVTSLPEKFNYYYDVSQGKNVSIPEVKIGDQGKNYGYQLFKDASVTWTVTFDGDLSGSGTRAPRLNDYLASYGIATAADIQSGAFENLVRMYVWIKVVDAVGNVTEVCRGLNVDPQGDRPEIEISYPESNGKTVGGTVNLNGSVTDPANANPIEKDTVWLQIISDKVTGHGSYNYDASTAADPTGFTVKAKDVQSWVGYNKAGTPLYKVYKMKDYIIGGTNTPLNDPTAAAVTDADAKDYGILAAFGATNWNLAINSASEFNKDDDTNQVAVCVYAYNGKFSVPTYRVMTFDADAPEMSERYLRQFNGSVISASRAYTDNIYVMDKNEAGTTDTWYISFKLTDSDKIAKIGFSNSSALDAKTKAGPAKDSSYCEPVTPGDYGVIVVSYPLNSLGGADGKESLYVYYEDAKDTNPGSGHYSFVVNHDNTSPVLTTSGADYNINPDVCNKDGWYTLGSKAEEGSSESGFASVVVYFLRKNSNKVFDPMYSKGYKIGDKDVYYSLTNASDISYKEGLYWRKKAVSAALENNATTLTLSASDPNVHTGGLVKIMGVNYRIKSASGTSVVLASDIGVVTQSGKTVDAYFALGNVVDNKIKESAGEGFAKKTTPGYGHGYGSKTPAHDNDDGDLMIEKAVTTGTQTIWEAVIDSKNIPDGPIDICYTVYDAAGNYATGSVTNKDDGAFVANNAPKIANVTVGSDLNGNDTIDASEKHTWFATSIKSWDEALKEITIQGETAASAYISAKGKTAITPEILGGNGDLYYYYSYPAAASATNYVTGYNKTVFMASDTGTSGSREDQEAGKSADITLQVGDLKKAWKGTGKYEFKIYDSTEDTIGVPGLTPTVTTPTSQHADITLYMDNQADDTSAPTGEIQRFYWKDINDNSIYGSDSASDAKDLLGHIELEGELPNENFKRDSGEYDKDPKVSGKIVLRGKAFDAVRLDSLYISLPGFTGLTGLPTTGNITKDSKTFYKLAVFDPATSKWSDSDDEETPKTIDANGWRFNVESDKFEKDGHYVTWALELDTNKYNRTVSEKTVHAGNDVLLEFMSKDMGQPTCPAASGTKPQKYTGVDGTTKYAATEFASGKTSDYSGDGGYRMDIVPYITKVYTNLATASASNWSVYNRTAGGAYPVYVYKNSTTSATAMEDGESETVQVYGFNLTALQYDADELNAVAAAERQDKNAAYDCYSFAAGALTGSKAVDFNVGGVETLNNKNANDAKGDYAGTPAASPSTQEELEAEYGIYANYYNRLPNDSNNNRLNDDVKFDVWQLNNSAAVPISNKIVDPVMKINPNSGKLGFAFENDPTYFSMPNGKAGQDGERSYDYWAGCYDKMTVPSFDYTDQGEVVALAQGNDISASNADNFTFYYSKWGTSTDSKKPAGSSTQVNGYGLEQIGYKYGNKNYWDKSRFQGTSVVSANKRVYLAYYDRVTSQIRFRSSLGIDMPDSIPGRVDISKTFSLGNNFQMVVSAPSAAHPTASFQLQQKSDNKWNNVETNNNYIKLTKKLADGTYDEIKSANAKSFNISYLALGEYRIECKGTYNNNTYNATRDFILNGIGNISSLNNRSDDHSLLSLKVPVANAQIFAAESCAMSTKATDYKPGEHLCLAAKDGKGLSGDDLVVMVWYDGTDCYYSYNTTPSTDRSPDGKDRELNKFDGTTGWSKPHKIFSGAGQYCKVAFDFGGGVHIAAYDSENSCVRYAYSVSPTDYSKFKTCIVGARDAGGSYLTLDVALNDSGVAVPQIGYYSTSAKPVLAKYNGPDMKYPATTANSMTGAVGKYMTGVWEISVVPSTSVISLDRVNVALRKDSSGRAAAPATGTSYYYNNASGYSSDSYGVVYGLANTNAVMGYCRAVGAKTYIETAQKKELPSPAP